MLSEEKEISTTRYPPIIEPLFNSGISNSNRFLYHKLIQNALQSILPNQFLFPESEGINRLKGLKEQFHSFLPLIKTTLSENLPAEMSFFALSKTRVNSFKFFFDVICSYLMPGKTPNMLFTYTADFRLPELSDENYTLYEVMMCIDNRDELDQIVRHLPIIETQLRLGIQSSDYARRILEIKNLVKDQKAAAIEEYIAWLISKFPNDFDHDILTEMQYVLVMNSDQFKAVRECRYLSRIISIHYLFRKGLKGAVKISPKKRHLSLKILKTHLELPMGHKKVLGLLVGVNFLRDKEIFEEKHLITAIQNYIPSAQVVENSFFANRRGSENICTLYLEIEKNNGQAFLTDEIRVLRRQLPSDLKDRIEYLLHPVFMPRNEEEIIRNILSLSSQIKYLRDIPQVFISFDEQTPANLFFTIIFVRVLRPGSLSIQELFKNADSFLEYIHDRCQNAGNLRRKYKKEATVFRVKFPKEPFLRRDNSIDLNKARQAVVAELCRVVGDIRDYNGGMISKQNELICEVRHLLTHSKVKYNDLLLENFFYSLTPVIMRTVLEPQALKSLFLFLIESIEQAFIKGENYLITELRELQFAYVMIKVDDRSLKDIVNRAIAKLQLHSSELAYSHVIVNDITYLGYIYRCSESVKQNDFFQTIQSAINQWDCCKVIKS